MVKRWVSLWCLTKGFVSVLARRTSFGGCAGGEGSVFGVGTWRFRESEGGDKGALARGLLWGMAVTAETYERKGNERVGQWEVTAAWKRLDALHQEKKRTCKLVVSCLRWEIS